MHGVQAVSALDVQAQRSTLLAAKHLFVQSTITGLIGHIADRELLGNGSNLLLT